MTLHDFERQVLRCPACGFDYVKFATFLIPGRSDLIFFQCESSCKGLARFAFHKGQTELECVEMGDLWPR